MLTIKLESCLGATLCYGSVECTTLHRIVILTILRELTRW